MAQSAVLFFRGTMGFPPDNVTPSYIRKILGTSFPFLIGLGNHIDSRSTANFHSWSYTQLNSVDPDPPLVSSNVDRKAVIYFRDETEGKVRTFSFPDPIPSICESTPAGTRVLYSEVVVIVSDLATISGHTLTPLYGIVYQRS